MSQIKKTDKDINWLTISDIHFGHDKNTTEEITQTITPIIYRIIQQNKLDIIFLAGDVYHKLLSNGSSDAQQVYIWMTDLMLKCYEYGIKLRILEGTPSHDNGQCSVFINTAKKINAFYEQKKITPLLDFKYINDIEVEFFYDLDLSVLYVPDVIRNSAEDVYTDVKKVLKENNTDKVDIGIMHVEFEGQIPDSHHRHVHKLDDYTNIVRYYINVGHIHKHRVLNDIILVQGSPDRTEHGQEEKKGMLVCSINKEYNTKSFIFVENKEAKTFMTIKLKTKDMESGWSYIRTKLQGLKHGSRIKIKAAKDHPILNDFNELKIRFPFYVFSKENLKQEINTVSDTVITDYVPIVITPSNIKELLLTEITNTKPLNSLEMAFFEKLFDN